jgi:hypothetical protein
LIKSPKPKGQRSWGGIIKKRNTACFGFRVVSVSRKEEKVQGLARMGECENPIGKIRSGDET